jgi:hypothetical protein
MAGIEAVEPAEIISMLLAAPETIVPPNVTNPLE